jgi:hypothetical protein
LELGAKVASVGVETKFNKVIEALTNVLKPVGYTKRRHTFRRLSDGNSAVIEVQRSVESDKNTIKFTINIGVVCGRLLEDWEPLLIKAGSSSAHLRNRIGYFLSEPHDKWWVLDASTDTSVINSELSTLLERNVVPYLSQHVSDRDLIALWETGRSPGLTEEQRVQHLRTLTAGL